MKLHLKKITLITLVFNATTAYAAMFNPPPTAACLNGAVSTPACLGNNVEVGIDGLYVQPYGQNASIVPGNQIRTGNNDTTVRRDNFYPSWAGGFRLYGNFQFLDGKYIGADWTYFKSNTDNRFSYTFSLPQPFGPTVISQHTDNDIRFNEINLKAGQVLQVGERATVNYYAGLRFTQINNDFNIRLAIPSLTNSHLATIENDNKFRGLGPVLGGKLTYTIANGFSLFGEGAAAVLLGTRTLDVTIRTSSLPITPGGTFRDTFDERQAVFAFDGKLGGQYTWAMPRGELSIRAGWQASVYNNALLRLNGVSFCSTDTSCSGLVVPSASQLTSFGYQGPFVGISGRFNT